MKRFFLVLVALFQFAVWPSYASDYAREKKWADEIVPGLVVGDAVYIKQQNGHEFLSLYTPANNAKSALVVVHGIGIHPDWGLIGMLRGRLADMGYTTLSIQMPILANDAKGSDYPPTFPEASERLKLAVEFLKGKGYSSIAVVSHSLGSRMSYAYFTGQPDSTVKTWVAIGMGEGVDYGVLKLPVLDLFGGKDLQNVLANAGKREQTLMSKPGSRQQVVPGADHFFEGRDDALVDAVSDYLKERLGN